MSMLLGCLGSETFVLRYFINVY